MLKVIICLVLTMIISYLLGSCNSSIIVVKLLKHEDIREHGSRNAGLTNTLRCYGKLPALFTLIGDLVKGIAAVLLSLLVFRLIIGGECFDNPPEWYPYILDEQSIGYISGFFAILGHIFPIYYGFKGGKGILVSSSILIVIDPLTFAIIIPFFAIVLFITRYVSVSSISAAVFYPILTFLLHYFAEGEPLATCITHVILVTGTSILLIYMHRANIKRLKEGTENKFSFSKKQ
ncbi:MAG: glycerol-3-phosphate 1-O-acyltransferase PlsY [Oscillospiraceae bacterium]|nr:glycerol-3-phosphate 1-O-acyltransferase PlsY [Oscillospiraceae bacterium]